MESSRTTRMEKRAYEEGMEDEAEDQLTDSKKRKLPALARFVSYFHLFFIGFIRFPLKGVL